MRELKEEGGVGLGGGRRGECIVMVGFDGRETQDEKMRDP